MPELPEVETVVLDLHDLISGKNIERLEILDEKVWFESEFSPEEFNGRPLRGVSRRGKYIVYDFSGKYLLQHLRMTGKMLPEGSVKIPHNVTSGQSKQLRARFIFTDGSRYLFFDSRRFGTLSAVSDLVGYFNNKGIAPEIFAEHGDSLAREHFINKARKLRKAIKSVVLDQKVICGPGNIYADEALHSCGIHPETPANRLNQQQLEDLFDALKQVMAEAISKRGTTAANYLDVNGNPGEFKQFLNVYGRFGEDCRGCRQGKVNRVKIGGRTSHYCAGCQPLV